VIHKKEFLYDYTMRIKYDISLQTYDILEDTKNILIMVKNLNKCTFYGHFGIVYFLVYANK
jgi:hypothetical protein